MNSIAFSPNAATVAAAQPNPRLVSAAHEFEASMMKEFLKPLQHDSLFSENPYQGDEDSGGSNSALMSFGAEAMAKALSEHGGFGMATKIIDHFQTANGSSQSAKKMPETHF